MSHFTVLVVGDNPEKQLAPFQENNMGDCPEEFLEFVDQEAEELEAYRDVSNTASRVIVPAEEARLYSSFRHVEGVGATVSRYDDAFKVPLAGYKVLERLEEVQVPLNKVYLTFEDYMKDYCGYESRDKKQWRYGYWENPNKKWDWYRLGGRWNGYLKLKVGHKGTPGFPGLMTQPAEEGFVDQCRVGNVDWDSMSAERRTRAESNWSKYQDYLKNPEKKVDGRPLDPYFDLGLENVDGEPESKEAYMLRHCSVATFALLKDGVWCERGDMGWWGIVSDDKDPGVWEKQWKLIVDSLPIDTLISVYDCHI